MKKSVLGFVVLLAVAGSLIVAWPVAGQEDPAPPPTPAEFWVMTWNVENLHGPDAHRGDRDAGIRRPSAEKYAEKLRRLREVVRRVNWGAGPDVLCLTEVESRKVVADLLKGLPGPGWRIHVSEGKSRRRINTAIAIRGTMPPGEKLESFDPSPKPGPNAAPATGRLVTHAYLPLGHTNLHLFVAHLKSKWNLGDETEETRLDENIRRREAKNLRAAVEGLGRRANVVITGDFNEDYRDHLFRREFLARAWHRGDPRPEAGDEDRRLLNLGGALQQSYPGGGTHYYEPVSSRYGRSYFAPNWSILDSFLISEPMSQPGGLYVTPYDAYIAVHWDLLDKLGTPGKLRRAHPSQPYYATGVSDHLPVVLRVRVHEPRKPGRKE